MDIENPEYTFNGLLYIQIYNYMYIVYLYIIQKKNISKFGLLVKNLNDLSWIQISFSINSHEF